ncbi:MULTISPECIES: PDGLE domain-containing protein [unclassified Lebetimonas]|uniref:PDGLE domain-containing protein n=1 Tax=unclassified Lebetimonas TaxID=2648158 RepID=UPI0004648331|nr:MULTISPECIES: PDGLE domain-containing protein [unclassified Lebetimonas]
MNKKVKTALIIMVIMIAAVPVGLLTSAPAFGEWDNDYYQKVLGFIPKGLANFPQLAHPLLPDYSLPGTNDVLGYYVSAVVGSAVVFIILYLIGKFFAKKNTHS